MGTLLRPMDIASAPTLSGGLRVTPLPDGRSRVEVDAPPGMAGAPRAWTTRYPPDLVREIHATKGLYVCDEIMREEDPDYVERAIRREVLAYVEPREFAGRRVLDFGCGAGASTLVMGRLLPAREIVGVELQERLLRLARLRRERLGGSRIRFVASPSGVELPEDIGEFDYVVMSAVFEHLLPAERRALLPRLWRRLKPGGVLFINQTPHRWSPLERHTTGLPLINFLPDRLAARFARLSRRIRPDDDWNSLLRAGVRGATVGEIMGLVGGASRAALLPPLEGDAIDLWHRKLSRRHAWLKRGAWGLLKLLKPLGGSYFVPELTLAIRKTP